MNTLRDLMLWIWDFVVGDAVIAAGVAVAIICGAALAGHLHSWFQPVFVLIILATVAASLWRVVAFP